MMSGEPNPLPYTPQALAQHCANTAVMGPEGGGPAARGCKYNHRKTLGKGHRAGFSKNELERVQAMGNLLEKNPGLWVTPHLLTKILVSRKRDQEKR